MTRTDPRALRLAEARQQMAHEATGIPRRWDALPAQDQQFRIGEAEEWLAAAIKAGLIPPADRPSDNHDAVWLDNYGQLWGEYQTSPPFDGDAILPLRQESVECSSKRDLEDQGAEFRLIGWSQ